MFKNLKLWVNSFFEEKKEEIKEEKKSVATYHAKERLETRHGEVLTDEMIASFITDIKSKKAEFLKGTREDTQAWIVTYKKKKYRIIYNYKTEVIITVYHNLKNKKVKPNRRNKNKRRKRLKLYDVSYKLRRIKVKKPYKRKKRVDYKEYSEML